MSDLSLRCIRRVWLLLVWPVCYYGMTPAYGSDLAAIQADLAAPVLAPDQPQREVEQFLNARLPTFSADWTREGWEREADRIRREMLEKVVLRGEAVHWRDAPLRVDWQEVLHGGDGYRIKKLRYEALPGLWIPALLYEPYQLDGRIPVGLNVNGHDPLGKAAPYKQLRCINQAKRGMLSLNVEWLGMGQLRSPGFAHGKLNQLDLCGTSGLAPFYLAMKRGLDVLLAHPHADAKRVAVAGLSGGGWQTIFISALDTRVTLANPVAGYSSFATRVHNHSDLGDSEQTPNDMATVGDYTHLTALLAPRAALLTYNVKDDCCFASDHALPPLLAAAQPIYRLLGRERSLTSHVNHDPGTHNFERDNREALYRAMKDHFFPAQSEIGVTDLESTGELKSAEDLQVTLPPDNLDLEKLARQLATSLPRKASSPTDSAAKSWQPERRKVLRETLRIEEWPVMVERVRTERKGDLSVEWVRLRCGEHWTVPGVVFAPPDAKGVTILVGEGGRETLASDVAELLANHQRVIAIDPFYWGESRIRQRAYLWALLVQAVGSRPAGLQASQILATTKWVEREYAGESLQIRARGNRATLAALAATALANQIERVELREGLTTLQAPIEQGWSYESHPELFCFGLLEQFDLPQLEALLQPRMVARQSSP